MIRVEHLTVRAGSFSLSDVSFDVASGAYAILMGRTGCGKTTLLETICGLRRPVSGRIIVMSRDVTALKPGERGIGYVPQESVLFRTMTVRDHLAFALHIRKRSRKEIAQRVDELAEVLALRHLLDRKPAGLSGGEAQRVALGRALAANPRILCLDEPLAALDHDTRVEVRGLLKRIQPHYGVTILHVTHDREEAARLADRQMILENGHIHEHDGAETKCAKTG
jgi:ABC-type sugar transport system ATPase subunit